ncbi:integrase [Hydrogenophilus thermoluteolus]|uniref:Integrase, partial n=1 Tax=Hydrogenophilus thermoluteolus TaxID=297 RepID=A0A2Z6E178_HYDTE|nr:integrase [Hydrogenophilus thermoluteolus]
MARRAVRERGISIRLACEVFGISETCYRYKPVLSAENAEIAHWLLRLTDKEKNWGFGLCFFYLCQHRPQLTAFHRFEMSGFQRNAAWLPRP